MYNTEQLYVQLLSCFIVILLVLTSCSYTQHLWSYWSLRICESGNVTKGPDLDVQSFKRKHEGIPLTLCHKHCGPL